MKESTPKTPVQFGELRMVVARAIQWEILAGVEQTEATR
jgi:hypothetical protein